MTLYTSSKGKNKMRLSTYLTSTQLINSNLPINEVKAQLFKLGTCLGEYYEADNSEDMQEELNRFFASIDDKVDAIIEEFIYEGYCFDYGIDRDDLSTKEIKAAFIQYLNKEAN